MAASNPRKPNQRRVSCETLCSSNSSCVLQKRKPLHPLATSIRARTSSNNPVSQRVLSAKLLRFKTLQNQLNDANYHITQLVNENKILKNLQKRQDNALSKYEGANAHLPQILESHQEEIRALQSKNKTLRKNIKELSDLIKTREEEINTLKDQNKHLLSLCKNKNLEERKELQDKVEDLEAIVRQNETTISTLNRKLMLESKNYKFKLNSEIHKHKQTQRELLRVMSQLQEISTSRTEIKLAEPAKKSFNKMKSQSVVQLCESKPSSILKKSPTNNKLTSSSLTSLTEDNNVASSSSSVKSQCTTLQEESSDISKSPDQDSSSEAQLKEIVNSWQKKSKIEEKIDEDLKNYRMEVMADVRFTNDKIDKHNEDYQNSMRETELIMQSLKENDVKNERLSKLNHSGDKMSFYDYSILSNKTTTDNLMEHMLNDKKNYSFEEDLLSETTAKINISDPEVDNEERRILLAKMKAIDNGDNVVVTDLKKPKCDLMKELFGS